MAQRCWLCAPPASRAPGTCASVAARMEWQTWHANHRIFAADRECMCCDTCTWDAWQHEPSSALHASTAHIVVVFMRAAHTALAHVLGCKCCGYEPAESSGGMNALGWRHRSAAAAGLQVQLKACTTTALQAPPGVPLPVIWRRAAQNGPPRGLQGDGWLTKGFGACCCCRRDKNSAQFHTRVTF